MWRVGDRVLPWGIQMDGGSDWIALSYPFSKYVASGDDDELLTGLKIVFKQTLLPAEVSSSIIFLTLVLYFKIFSHFSTLH